MYKKAEIENILEMIDANGPVPFEEPMRQYYFIKKCQGIVAQRSKKLGRALQCCTQTFGCPIV